MPTVLEAKALTKRFGKVAALRDCDVALPAGKVTGLVGPNGAGKTTLLQIAVGLRRASSGTIRVLDMDPADDTVALLTRVGYVGQDRPLYLVLTATETVCEHVVILANGRVRIAGDIDELQRSHFLVVGPRKAEPASTGQEVVDIREAERQTVRLVRGPVTWGDDDGTITRPATLEEVVLGYLRSSRAEVK